MTPDRFRQIWAIDFEFTQPDGERPDPICMVALELRSGVILRFGPDDLRRMTASPFGTAADVLVIAYYAVAEMACFLALGCLLELTTVIHPDVHHFTFADDASNPNGSSPQLHGESRFVVSPDMNARVSPLTLVSTSGSVITQSPARSPRSYPKPTCQSLRSV